MFFLSFIIHIDKDKEEIYSISNLVLIDGTTLPLTIQLHYVLNRNKNIDPKGDFDIIEANIKKFISLYKLKEDMYQPDIEELFVKHIATLHSKTFKLTSVEFKWE